MNKKIEEYLVEVSLSHDLVFEEVYALFLQTIAQVYDAFGSAYINDDGTILVAKCKENSKRLYLKHYVVSAKMYERIDRTFKKLLQEYDLEKTAERFIFANIGEVVEVKVLKVTEKNIYVTPILEVSSALGYKFILTKNKCFYDENLKAGDEIKVVYERVLREEKIVQVRRFNKLVCEAVFTKLFHKLINIVEEDYSYKEVDFSLMFKKKKILIFVKWEKLPTSFFRNYFENELKKVFGKCNLSVKKRSKEKEIN